MTPETAQFEYDSLLEKAEALVGLLKGGNFEGSVEIIDDLARIREKHMFQELGKLTRQLHDTLRNFEVDDRLSGIVGNIPDAKERLSYVIEQTDEAAHKTIGHVEATLPIAQQCSVRASELSQSWERLSNKKMRVEEFRELLKDTQSFFSEVQNMNSSVQKNLTDVLMAQGFQDITGQIIRKVIVLVQTVEDGLVDIIRVSGGRVMPRAKDTVPDSNNQSSGISELAGPQIPGRKDDDAVSGQDEVDDLLASLGF